MTDPFTIAVAFTTLAVAMWAAWLHVPGHTALDGERWFKLALATLLRGQVDAEEGTLRDWEAKLERWVLYHPAGRFPEWKVENPRVERLDAAPLPGERALIEALAAKPDAAARWRWLYDEDEAGLAARAADPFDLGAAYDPADLLGPGGSWDDLANWGAGEGTEFQQALVRRLPAKWVLYGGSGGPGDALLEALAAELVDVVVVPWDPDATEQADGDALKALLERPDQRLVTVGSGAGAMRMLRALNVGYDARDKVVAVLNLGGDLEPESDWMQRWFRHAELDREIVGLTPWFSVQWVDRQVSPAGIEGLPIEHQRFPKPYDDDNDLEDAIEPVDLGLLPADVPDLPLTQVARALWAITVCWVLRRA